LIVEDDKDLNKTVCSFLNHSGYEAIGCLNANDAYDALADNIIDLIVSDIMLPGTDGFEFATNVRELNEEIPIIFMTAKDDIASKQKGFRIGVDDYMVKPIDFDELLMRVKAVLRRAETVSERKLIIGSTVLDYDTLTVYDSVNKVSFTKKEFGILYKLLSYPEKSFSKSQLFEEFWSFDSDTEEDSVKVYINKIRNKINVFAEIDVDTVRGVGYRGVRCEK
jgi:DNA-binding response OmpR family regulator